MRTVNFILLTAGMLISLIYLQGVGESTDDINNNQKSKLLRHVVLLKFSAETADSVLKNLENDFYELEKKASEILELEWGTNLNEDGAFSHCLIVTFKNEIDLQKYLVHPGHKAIENTYSKFLANAAEVDYWFNPESW